MPFRCTVLTPDRVAFDGEVDSAVLPAHDGELGVRPGHADFLGQLGTGAARLRQAGSERVFAVNRGFLRVAGGVLKILAEEASPRESLSRGEAEAALKAALAERPKDPAGAGERDNRLAWARARLRILG